MTRTKMPAKTSHFQCGYHCVHMVELCYEVPSLCDFFTRKYWINLSENVCGSCLDIYLSVAERIYYRIYYFRIYLCLKIQFIAVALTEVSSLTELEDGTKISIFWNNSTNYHISANFPGSVDGRQLTVSFETKIFKIG